MDSYPLNVECGTKRFPRQFPDLEGIIRDRHQEAINDVSFYVDNDEKWDRMDEHDFCLSLAQLMYWQQWNDNLLRRNDVR